jgi:hypothetical protein
MCKILVQYYPVLFYASKCEYQKIRGDVTFLLPALIKETFTYFQINMQYNDLFH